MFINNAGSGLCGRFSILPLADELLAGVANDDDEIRVGQTAQLYEPGRASRANASAMMTS